MPIAYWLFIKNKVGFNANKKLVRIQTVTIKEKIANAIFKGFFLFLINTKIPNKRLADDTTNVIALFIVNMPKTIY
jgi:hypothetical protein